jgi:hypothetical protein
MYLALIGILRWVTYGVYERCSVLLQLGFDGRKEHSHWIKTDNGLHIWLKTRFGFSTKLRSKALSALRSLTGIKPNTVRASDCNVADHFSVERKVNKAKDETSKAVNDD